MHSFGHVIGCSELFAASFRPGTGLSKGEDAEQVFSMLSSFGKNSRKLRAQAWHYILTLLVAAKNQNMVSKLPQRKRAHKALLAAEKSVMSKTAELLNLM